MNSITITEKLLKDSFNRLAPASEDITLVQVDLRSATHDILHVHIRGQPAGQLVCDKNDSVTLSRRLLPESLRYGKEPSTIVRNMEQLGTAYGQLLMEVRAAISHGSTDSLRAYMRKLDAANVGDSNLPGDGHLFVSAGLVRTQREDQERSQTHGS